MLGVVAQGYPLADMDQPGIDLSGTWAATIADEPSRRAFFEPSYDDRHWDSVALPGHWRTHPAFASSDGPLPPPALVRLARLGG